MTDFDVITNTQGFDTNKKKWIGKIVFSLILLLLLWGIFRFIFKNPFGGIVAWDHVKVSYDATFVNWDLFESKIVDFIVGNGQVVDTIDKAVVWMKIWWIKHVLVNPEDWYAKLYDPRKIQQIPGLIFEKMDIVPVDGKVYDFWNIKWIVIEIKWEWSSMVAVIDTNPLETYMDLEYVIEIVE